MDDRPFNIAPTTLAVSILLVKFLFKKAYPVETLEKTQGLRSRKLGSKRNPEASKQALIDATLDTIAEIGITDTTVSSIIKRAGLSRGMIHLHFKGKDNLLTCAAEHYSKNYYSKMDKFLAVAGSKPEDIILSVVRADLSEELLNERSAKIWHAFRGVANSHSGIAEFSSTQDERLKTILSQAFKLISETAGQSDKNTVRHATFGTFALLEGMWVHYLSDMANFSRDDATLLIQRFLSGLFPGHFIKKL